jgi:transcriptional regulator with XRE-family HTH domain
MTESRSFILPTGNVPGNIPGMVPGVSRRDGRRRAAEFARDRRLHLGFTQPEVAEAAGVKDVKTIRNLETGRNWPNDLTKRGIETALRLAIGTLDQIADGEEQPDPSEFRGQALVGGQRDLPTAQELIDLSAAISALSHAQEAMLRRGDNGTAERVRALIHAVSAVMGAYRPALHQAAMRVERTDSPPVF